MPLTLDHWDTIEALFEASEGVGGCWCMWPLRPPNTHRPDPAANRAAFRAMVEAGDSPGLIAVAAGRAAGWCAAGPLSRYPQYTATEEPQVWAIPCVYIDPIADRATVASALLEAAIDLAKANGAVAVHGPPPWWLPGDEEAIAQATAIFVARGFERVGKGARIPELRLTL